MVKEEDLLQLVYFHTVVKKFQYSKPNDNNEIEFLIEKDGDVLPIEVKAGNTVTPSLNKFIENCCPHIAYKLINGSIGGNGIKKSIPHYMVIFL